MTLMHGLNRKYTVDCCSGILTCSIVEFTLGLYVLYILLQFTPLKKKEMSKKEKRQREVNPNTQIENANKESCGLLMCSILAFEGTII